MVLGAAGVEERDDTTLIPKGESAPSAGRAHVIAWLPAEIDREALQSRVLSSLSDDTSFELSIVDAEDWVEVVRAQIVPVSVGKRLRIRATWHEAGPIDGREELVLDPGLAFGTGTHPTTFLCLMALELEIQKRRDAGHSPSLLDLGCGSGILAIAALRLGASRALAIDNDPIAVEVTLENAARNHVIEKLQATTDGTEKHQGVYDLLVANIQLGVLRALAPSAYERVAPGGSVYLSGLLDSQADEAEAIWRQEGLLPVRQDSVDGWSLVELLRPF